MWCNDWTNRFWQLLMIAGIAGLVFDVDVCRAVAAAIFGDSSKVEFTTTTGKSRFPTLASGEIDMLARNTTWTLSRDVNLGFEFVGVNYYDGQGFMIPSALGVDDATGLDGATACIQTGTTTELNLRISLELIILAMKHFQLKLMMKQEKTCLLVDVMFTQQMHRSFSYKSSSR